MAAGTGLSLAVGPGVRLPLAPDSFAPAWGVSLGTPLTSHDLTFPVAKMEITPAFASSFKGRALAGVATEGGDVPRGSPPGFSAGARGVRGDPGSPGPDRPRVSPRTRSCFSAAGARLYVPPKAACFCTAFSRSASPRG